VVSNVLVGIHSPALSTLLRHWEVSLFGWYCVDISSWVWTGCGSREWHHKTMERCCCKGIRTRGI